ncbi:phospholipid scramblase 1-like isoform X1 [Megalobrama amblycephala]|uniref:phospholipid scramblase 1-like isoform X1 n=1 Tax=Megalobrama amblycephala TaxID=75352 RepID=UPI002013F336|nr:phospholipid scramblase 1-like isoform X1 [Megalobrama amblycephala]
MGQTTLQPQTMLAKNKRTFTFFVTRETFPVLISATAKQTIRITLIQSNMELSALENTAMMSSSDPYHCPSLLETLTRIDQLFVHKEQSLDEVCAEVCCGIKSNNRYTVKNDNGHKIFTILEDNDCCNRTCCAGARSFIMSVFNNSNQEIIRLVRPFVCNCCGNEVEVQSPPDVTIGYVRQNFHICLPKFTVENERGEPAFKIVKQLETCACCTDQIFELVSLNEAVTNRPFGKIFKPFSSSAPNIGVDFVVKFPRNLEVKMKATLLGACILIQMESKVFSENTYSGVVAMTPTASGDGSVSMEMTLSSAVARDS